MKNKNTAKSGEGYKRILFQMAMGLKNMDILNHNGLDDSSSEDESNNEALTMFGTTFEKEFSSTSDEDFSKFSKISHNKVVAAKNERNTSSSEDF